eukprot:scaffold31141_cov154-Skeletonema_menzelii.AAC.2
MSEENKADTSCCASCGVAEVDEIKLKECDDCDLVRYCSDECQIDHKPDHEEACKKRAAELRDELLFKQLESSHLGDCPVCCLPLSLDTAKSSMMMCCSKIICNGCACANAVREVEGRLKHTCLFCREPAPDTKEGRGRQNMKRVKANDPAAINQVGGEKYYEKDYRTAFEYSKKAAELGVAQSHFRLSIMYHFELGAEKDEGENIRHLEEAAIGGHPQARNNLGCEEWNNDNIERAVKHWIIAATQGDDDSTKHLMNAFKDGFVDKEVLAATLRAHKAAIDATKSPQREAAEKYFQDLHWLRIH